jgi:hypothetical protein
MKLNKVESQKKNEFNSNTEYRILANRCWDKIYKLEQAPLAKRKEARKNWITAMRNEEVIRGIIGGLFYGEYGEEAYYAAALIMCMNANANHAAKFGELIAGVEYQCPPRFARSGWNTLSAVEQSAVNAAVITEAAKWFTLKILAPEDV